MQNDVAIGRITVDPKYPGGRQTYKYEHSDGAACIPPVFSPSKPIPCVMCNDKKGDGLDVSASHNQNPKRAMCAGCYK